MKILLNSLPKSGTHLLKRFCELSGFKRFDMNLMGALLRETSKNPIKNFKKRLLKDEEGVCIDLDISDNKINKKWLKTKLEKVPDGYFLLGHVPYSEDLLELLLDCDYKIIHITRDPRDVTVSLMNHFLKFDNYPFHRDFKDLNSDEERLLLCLRGIARGATRLAPLKERIANTAGWVENDRVCSVLFNDLIGTKGGGDKKVQLATIKRMLNHLCLTEVLPEEIAEKIFYEKAETFNKGKISQWEIAFTDRVQREYNESLG